MKTRIHLQGQQGQHVLTTWEDPGELRRALLAAGYAIAWEVIHSTDGNRTWQLWRPKAA